MNIDEVRANVRARKARHSEARAVFEQVQARIEAGQDVDLPVAVFCPEHGCPERVVSVFRLGRALLFVSRLGFRPADLQAPPPWKADELLRSLSDDHIGDDEILRLAVETANRNEGQGPDTPRWVASMPVSWVLDLLDAPADPSSGWRPTLWARCQAHPGTVEVIDRDRAMAATRKALRDGRTQRLGVHHLVADAR